MRVTWLVAASGAGAVLLAATSHVRADEPAPSHPAVVVELFTSEGCSSCPPADDLLRQLAVPSMVPGVQIIPLSEHVDYWNHSGWRDPFSSSRFSDRQEAYDRRVFHAGVYTPQMIVDGAYQGVGSNPTVVRDAIALAAGRPKGRVEIQTHWLAAGTLRVDLAVDVPQDVPVSGRADLVLVVTEDGLVSMVTGGENGGRQLVHIGVVRHFATVGTLAAGARTLERSATVAWAPGLEPAARPRRGLRPGTAHDTYCRRVRAQHGRPVGAPRGRRADRQSPWMKRPSART